MLNGSGGSSGTADGFVVDLAVDMAELDAVIADVQACETRLETLTDDLDRQVRALQDSWEGLAAQAQQEAHAEWTRGMRDMRTALADLRAAARQAHSNYSGAADTNVAMWRQVH